MKKAAGMSDSATRSPFRTAWVPALFAAVAVALLLATRSPAAAAASRTSSVTFGVGTYTLVANDKLPDESEASTERMTFRIEKFNPRTGRFWGTGNQTADIFERVASVTGTLSDARIDMRVALALGRVDHDRGRIGPDGTITGSLTADNGVRGTWVMTTGTGGGWWTSMRVLSVSLLGLVGLLLLLAVRLSRRTARPGLDATQEAGKPPPYWPPPPGWEPGPVLPSPVEPLPVPPSDQPPFWPPPPGWQPGADVATATERPASRAALIVRGVLSTLALLSGGFLIVLGVFAFAVSGDQQGSGAVMAGYFCFIFAVPFVIVGVRGWRGLRRRWRSAQ